MYNNSRQAVLAGFAIAAVATLAILGLNSCEQANGDAGSSDGWLSGDPQQKFETLADQLGGFSQTMVEVGYRYSELYWAGEDENWEFATYQIEHIEEALEAGLQRRPEYEASADSFINHALPAVSQAVEDRDRAAFREQFQRLSMHCNACHAMEDVAFINVRIPAERYRPWGAP